jgi:hypothetical protein
MHQAAIFYPVAALALLTLSVLLLVPYQRFKAALAKKITPDDFKYGESANVPPEVSIPNRNMMNLLELPLLFYVACLMMFVTHTVDGMAMNLAWAYFALRVGHSFVHLTYNNVIHRMTFFALSNFVLTVIWLRILLSLSKVTT